MSSSALLGRLLSITFLLFMAALPRTASAQLPSFTPPHVDIKDFDPTNKNSEFRKDLAHADDVLHKQINSALGNTPYSVTLRNPTKKAIFYSFNGEEQIALPAGVQVNHRGNGDATIRFDRGLGDDSFFDYSLPSGKTYHFQRVMVDMPEVGKVSMLNLFKDPAEKLIAGANAAKVGNGDIFHLQCLGNVEGPRWLDGNTIAGTAQLAGKTQGLSGTRWRAHVTDQGDVYLECLGNVDGRRWLDGNTVQGTVALAPRTNGFSGTRWQIHAGEGNDVFLKCMGVTEGPRWLDGNTVRGTAGLAKTYDGQSGSKWRLYKE